MAFEAWSIVSALRKIGIAAIIMAAFIIGLAGTVYLSLRSPEVKVPNVVNKERSQGESILGDVGLKVRVRAYRFKADAKPGLILDQSPRAGETVKAGQTIAVVLSRAPKEGEVPAEIRTETAEAAKKAEGETASKANENKNEPKRNRVATVKNVNKNVTNQNTNNANRNAQNPSGANQNAVRNTNANKNANANVRNVNKNANQNANANKNGNSGNRREPIFTAPPTKPN